MQNGVSNIQGQDRSCFLGNKERKPRGIRTKAGAPPTSHSSPKCFRHGELTTEMPTCLSGTPIPAWPFASLHHDKNNMKSLELYGATTTRRL